MSTDFVLLDDQKTGRQMYFSEPSARITARVAGDLPQAFAAIETALAEGHYLAGFFAYELGYALEAKLAALLPETDLPLIDLGVFTAPSEAPAPEFLYTRTPPNLDLKPSWTEAEYLARFDPLKEYLRAGDCYQVNLTFPMFAETNATPAEIFAGFRRKQPGRYGALVNLGDTALMSFSPELFFEKRGAEMRMRPMKGTRPRAGEDDTQIARDMQAEPKSRAENLMIVDLLRNDLSKLCKPGSVEVPELFALETYPTLYQMTSEVRGTLNDGIRWEDIFRGLFPCGSVTGAPKIRAMEIISELETGARGAYCGSIGYLAPNGDAGFNVAIRTAHVSDGVLRYDVGSGVVYDSDGPDEYRECLLKSKILNAEPEHLIETFLQKDEGEFQNLAAHLGRLKAACLVRDWPFDLNQIKNKLAQFSRGHSSRIKLTTNAQGEVIIEQSPFAPIPSPLKLCVSRYPLTDTVQQTDIKTSRRDFYDGERARLMAAQGCDEVIFLNAQGHVCEGSFTSLFIQRANIWLTPPISDGLLPSILRAELLRSGDAVAQTLTLDDLVTADEICVGNSLRGLCAATLISSKPR